MNLQQFIRTQDVVFEMLRDRHYIIDDSQKLSSSDFENANNSITLTFSKKNGIKILVLWQLTDSVSVLIIRQCTDILYKDNIKNAIIIKTGKYTPSAKTAVAELINMYTIQIFDVEDVMNNVTKHSLVPTHELLSKTETDIILKEYLSEKNQLPRISAANDPVIKYYAWPRGKIVKITRKNGSIYYRRIV